MLLGSCRLAYVNGIMCYVVFAIELCGVFIALVDVFCCLQGGGFVTNDRC